ncbi:MAG TPA: hypothetical protein VFG23_12860 [Polyangia bacterium]|nr:hypothetical protein [Polyangia bacterium]
MAGRGAVLRDHATAMAVAFGDPDKIAELYPKPKVPMTAYKWWGDADGR